jgi:phage terminase large subunit GpA-like protein
MEAPTLPPPSDAAELLRLFAQAITPPPRRTVDEWAEACRIVTEGSRPGPWFNARTPYLIEPMRRASLSHPARWVSIQGSAQAGKTQIGLNLIGQILSETPTKVLVLLPSINSARMYNRDKLEPMLADTPVLQAAVADLTSRDGQGSTTTVKRGARGAQVEIVTASSSKDLQSRTVRVVINDEVTEFPVDVDNRGDPVDLAVARTINYWEEGEKIVNISTPGIKGACRISKYWEDGTQGEYHVDCPHCGGAQVPKIAHLTTPRATDGTLNHDEARYACEHCGVLISQAEWRRSLEAGGGRWVHNHPERENKHSSYRFNVLISPFVPWSKLSQELEAATNNPIRAKAFSQQFLGEPWDEAHDLPKADILLLRRDRWQPGRIPPQVIFMMGATDVQGDRLPWAVWGFDRHFGQWLIDTGTLEGDPTLPAVWQAHDELLRRRWPDAWGKPVGPDVWGIDSGFLAQHVYAYVRARASQNSPELRALDGRPGWRLPALGTPKRIDVDWQGARLGSVALWPVGTWDLKSELASALRLTEQGPGPDGWPASALRFNEMADRAWLEELLSEHCVTDPRTGARTWKKVNARNEAWDLAVYTRALARQATLRFTDADWSNLAAARQGPPAEAQPDLAQLWAPDLKAQAEAAIAKPHPARVPPPAAIAPAPRIVLQPRPLW